MGRLPLTVFGLTAHPLCSVSPEDANILTVRLRVGQVMFLSHQQKFKLFLLLQPLLRSTNFWGESAQQFLGMPMSPPSSFLVPFLVIT